MGVNYGAFVPIIEVKYYSGSQCNGVEKEQERMLDKASRDKINYVPELGERNEILYHDPRLVNGDFRGFVDKVLEDERKDPEKIVKNQTFGDSKNATKPMVSIVISMSTEMYQSMTQQERDQYFRDSLDYVVNNLYPGCVLADARIHRDEGYFDEHGNFVKGQDHGQFTLIPIYRELDKKTEHEKVSIATSKHETRIVERNFEETKKEYESTRYQDKNGEWKTKTYNKPHRSNWTHDMQREFVKYTREKQKEHDREISERTPEYYYRKNMSPKEFKTWQDATRQLERERQEIERLKADQERNHQEKIRQLEAQARKNEQTKRQLEEQARKNNEKLKEAIEKGRQEIKAAKTKNQEKEFRLADKEKELNKQEQQLKELKDKHEPYKEYYEFRDDYCKTYDITPYEYEKQLRNYERSGIGCFEYYSDNDQQTYRGALEPELNNPDRTPQEKQQLERQINDWYNGRDELEPVDHRSRLETKDPEHELPSLGEKINHAKGMIIGGIEL